MLHHVTYGDPSLPPLLIAHGLYGQHRNWAGPAKALSDRSHVTCVDMRNHGESLWDTDHSYDALAGDLVSFAPEPVDVIGHSMGGKAAMMMALSHPDKVKRLIVGDIAPVEYDHSQRKYIEAMRSVDLNAIERRTDAVTALGVEPEIAGFLTQSLDLKAKRWKYNLDVLDDQMDLITGWPDIDAQFDGPALFLAGANSDYITDAYRPEIKRYFPNARVVKINNAGHWFHAERPNQTVEVIRAFLSSSAP